LQKAEDESRRAERLQKLKEVRMREQVKFDEQSVSMDTAFMLKWY
jgi:translation initiation factor IF-3